LDDDFGYDMILNNIILDDDFGKNNNNLGFKKIEDASYSSKIQFGFYDFYDNTKRNSRISSTPTPALSAKYKLTSI
jgi:hypothetical protein